MFVLGCVGEEQYFQKIHQYKMSIAMDKAMMALSLDEDDVPFEMPNLSQFRLSERNARSLIGRILNPDYQKIFRVIHEILGSGKRRVGFEEWRYQRKDFNSSLIRNRICSTSWKREFTPLMNGL